MYIETIPTVSSNSPDGRLSSTQNALIGGGARIFTAGVMLPVTVVKTRFEVSRRSGSMRVLSLMRALASYCYRRHVFAFV